MELVNYLRIVRRRWRVVLALTVVGVILGAGTTLFTRGTDKNTNVTWYLAKHTLASDGSTNLQFAADQATDPFGEIPKRAAAKLGADNPSSLVANVRAEPRSDTNVLYIAAVGTDPARTAQVADAFAEELVVYLREYGETKREAATKALDDEIRELEAQFGQLQQQLNEATDDTQRKLLDSQQADLARKINDRKAQRTATQNQAAPSQTLTTLSTAEALPVSEAAVQKLLATDSRSAAGKGSATQNATASSIDTALSSSSGSSPLVRALFGGFAGLFAGAVLVIVLDRLDPRIRTKFEAEDAFGWPVIGEIPPLTRRERHEQAVLSWTEPRSRAAEAYRVLRSSLLFAAPHEDADGGDDEHPIFAGVSPTRTEPAVPRPLEPETVGGPNDGEPASRGQVIMVTSPNPSEGKTTTTANLAAILAETGRSVLVINCDFRRPRVHTFLGCDDVPRKVVDTELDGVKLVSQVAENPNDANPAEVVQLQRQVIRNARRMFDIVLLDTAPLLTTNDATEVLSVTDQVVVVARTGKTHKEAADRAAELLERRNAPVVGIVLNGATDVPTSRYYYYGDNPDLDEPEPGEESASPLAVLVPDAADGATATSAGDDDDDRRDPAAEPDAAEPDADGATADEADVAVVVGADGAEGRGDDEPGGGEPGGGAGA